MAQKKLATDVRERFRATREALLAENMARVGNARGPIQRQVRTATGTNVRNQRAAATWERKQAAKRKEAKSGGGSGGWLDDLVSGATDFSKDALGKALEVIDVPRAWTASGLNQASLAAANLFKGTPDKPPSAKEEATKYATSVVQEANTNPEKPDLGYPEYLNLVKDYLAGPGAKKNREDTAYYKATQPSFENFTQDAKHHKGFRDYVETANQGPVFGGDLGALDMGLGVAVDIAQDPLSSVVPALHGAEVLGAAQKFRDIGDLANAAKLERFKTAGAVSKEALDTIGVKGGLEAFGKTVVPHDLWAGATKPLRAARGAGGDLLDKLPGIEKVRGWQGEFKKMARSEDPLTSYKGATTLRAKETERVKAAGIATDWQKSWDDLTKNVPDHNGAAVIDAIERGDRNAIQAFRDQGVDVDGITGWMGDVRTTLTDAGVRVGHQQNYMPRFVTQKMVDLKAAGQRGNLGETISSLVKERKIAPGSKLDWIEPGLTVPADLAPGSVRAWVNREAERVLGHAFYSTDLKGLGRIYAKQAGNLLGEQQFKNRLVEAGLGLTAKDAKALRHATNSNVAQEAKLAEIDRALGANDVARTGLEGRATALANDTNPALDELAALHPENMAGRRAQLEADLASHGEAGKLLDEQRQNLDTLTNEDAARTFQNTGEAPLPNADVTDARAVADDLQARYVRSGESLKRRGRSIEQRAREIDAAEERASNWDEMAARETDEVQKELALNEAARERANAKSIDMLGKTIENDIVMRNVNSKVKAKAAREIDNLTFRKITGMPGFRADPEVVDALQRVQELTKPNNINAFWKTYDKVQTWLKSYQIATPGFHFRNAFGGMFNNALAGINPSIYIDWFRANRAFSKGGEVWDKWLAANKDLGEAYVNARHISGYGQIGFESGGGAGKGSFNPFRVDSKGKSFGPIKWSRHAGENVEHFLRGSLAMDALRKGHSIEDAVSLVEKYHFNYGDLTSFETKLKRVVPFYTWTRRNMPLQMEMLIKRPSVYSKYNAVTRNVSHGLTMPDVVPSYYGENNAVQTPFTEQGQSVFYMPTNQIPLGDLADPLDPSKYLSMVTPLIKTPLELDRNKQAFKGIPLTGRMVDMPGVYKVIPGLPEAMGALGLANKKGQVRDDALYTIDQAIPIMARARRQFPDEKRYDERTWTSWLNFMFGLGLRTNTKQDQKNELLRRKFTNK